MKNRRNFLKKSVLAVTGLTFSIQFQQNLTEKLLVLTKELKLLFKD